MSRWARQEETMRQQFEQNAQIVLQEQAKRERAAYLEQLSRIKDDNQEQTRQLARETVLAKNKTDKLNREVLEKEQMLLDLQNKLALSESDLRGLKEQLALADAKQRALEAFSSDLQQKYDKLETRCKQKEEQLHDLLANDLPAKVTEQRAQINSLE